MKRCFSAFLAAAMLALLLGGCACETAEVTIAQDGSGSVCVRFGFSEAAAERLELYEALGEEGFAAFSYQGKTYLGDTAVQRFASVSELNGLFAALNERAVGVSAAGSLGQVTIAESGGGFALTLVCGEETGSRDAMSAALRKELPALTDGEIAGLLDDAVMLYSFTFPSAVRQTDGGSAGVTVNGSTVKIDLLACPAGAYTFTTAAGGTCDRGASCPLSGFADLESGRWYHDGIHYCLENGIMNGTDEAVFAPDAAATRGMIFTVLARMDGVTVTSAGSSWFADGAAWASSAKISDGTNPTSAVTRAELALMLYRFAHYSGCQTGERAALDSFSDAAEVGAWMADALAWAVGSGVMTGSGGALRPGDGASRAETAAMLYRFCTKVLQ